MIRNSLSCRAVEFSKPIAHACEFPPANPTSSNGERVVRDFCNDCLPNKIEEALCAVCAELHIGSSMCSVSSLSDSIYLLEPSMHGLRGVSHKERPFSTDVRSQPAEELDGPLLVPETDRVCRDCFEHLMKDNLPPKALANGLWIGDVPSELKGLTYAEKLLVARARNNQCIVKVNTGGRKMKANAIAFPNPTPRIYNLLPPSKG